MFDLDTITSKIDKNRPLPIITRKLLASNLEKAVENDNFLKYEDEYGTYKENIVINKDNDIIEIDEIVE